MASNGKKGKKKKMTTLSIQEFLGPKAEDLVIKKTSWADEMEQQGNDLDDDPSTRVVINRSVLPTAPRSALGANVDLSRVPKEKPFTAFLANLPFEVSNEDIQRFFKDLGIVTIRLLTDSSGRLKGNGYVEFETREMLIEALNYADSMMKGRSIRVDLADQHDRSDRDRPDGGFRSRDRDRDDGEDKTLGDWRRKAESSSDRYPGREKRDTYEQDRYDGKDHHSSDRFDDRGGEGRRAWGGAGSRDGDRYGNFNSGRSDRGSHDDRDRDRDRDFGRSSFGSSFRTRDQYSFDGDRFGGSGQRRSEDRFRSDNGRFRNDDDRFRSDDRYRNDRNRNTDRYENERFQNSERRSDGRFRDGDGDRSRDYDRNDAKPGGRGRIDDKEYGDKNRDRKKSDSHDEEEEGGRGGHEGGRGGHEGGREGGRGQGRDFDREAVVSRSRDISTEKEKAGPKERPRLNLQPRTKPLEEAGQMATSAASIFGGAKPVDTTQRLREIEEKQTSKLRQRQEKENRSGHDTDQPPAVISRQTSSEGGQASDESSAYKRQNSASSKGRQRKDSAQDGSGSEKQKDRPPNANVSSGRGSTSGRKPSHTEPEEVEPVEIANPEKSAAAAAAAAVKMVPAPPPKENFWERRKTAAQQQQHHTAPAQPTDAPDAEEAEPEAAEEDGATKDLSREEKEDSPTVKSVPVSSASETMPIPNDPASSHGTATVESSSEPAAETPVVNIWEARRKENEAKSQKVERVSDTPSTGHEGGGGGEVRKRAVVSVGDIGARASFGGPERSDRRPGGPSRGGEGGARGGGRGGIGTRRSEGSDARRSDADGKRSGSKKEKEKPLPASVDEMPKLEDKSKKDWSDSNKFSTLLMDEDEGSDGENRGSKCEDD